MRITMPLALVKDRKNKDDMRVPLSMNWYRNAHYYLSNWAKKEYKEIFKSKVDSLAKRDKIIINITLRADSNRDIDLDNRCIVQSKFLGDALVELGFLEDDNCKHIKEVHYYYGGIDKGNGRVDIEILEI